MKITGAFAREDVVDVVDADEPSASWMSARIILAGLAVGATGFLVGAGDTDDLWPSDSDQLLDVQRISGSSSMSDLCATCRLISREACRQAVELGLGQVRISRPVRW